MKRAQHQSSIVRYFEKKIYSSRARMRALSNICVHFVETSIAFVVFEQAIISFRVVKNNCDRTRAQLNDDNNNFVPSDFNRSS